MKITNEWLHGQGACVDGYAWALRRNHDDAGRTIAELMNEDRFDWANWVIVRLMTHEQQIQYAVFAAEQVISIYEKEYPDDDRPRKAIEAARAVLENRTDENVEAEARAEAEAARARAEAARARAAEAAAAAARAAWAARADVKTAIIRYGMELLNI